MIILDGKLVAQKRQESLRQKVKAFTQNEGRAPGLTVVLVGDDPASQVYVRNKVKACEKVGIQSKEIKLPAQVSAADLKLQISKLAQDEDVDGILVQLPLPKHLNADEVIGWLPPHKDADGLTASNVGLFWQGHPRSSPCTPAGVMALLEHYQINPSGMSAVVIGRSQIVGRPMVQFLLEADATVTIAHSKTKDLSAITRKADLVVVAAGKPEFLGAKDFKKDAIVIDVGIHRQQHADGSTRLCGDVKFNELEGHVRAATPVPGGVGPLTIAMLLENTLKLAELRQQTIL